MHIEVSAAGSMQARGIERQTGYCCLVLSWLHVQFSPGLSDVASQIFYTVDGPQTFLFISDCVTDGERQKKSLTVDVLSIFTCSNACKKKKIIQDLNAPITMDSYLVIMIMFLKESCTKINVKNELRLQG